MSLRMHRPICSTPPAARRHSIPSPLGGQLPFPPGNVGRISDCFRPRMMMELIPKSASVTGSGADFPEQWVGTPREKKRRAVAGVDQEELLDPEMIADPDSFFCDFNGVKIHHKISHSENQKDHSVQLESSYEPPRSEIGKFGFPMILLHGFGASLFSWGQVMKPLARLTGSKVLAFDRPAFGLTSRTAFMDNSSSGKADSTPLNPYSMAFSVLATLSFIDLLGAQKAILMGHSAGCLVAVNTYFEAPERIAALILVAPAIFAPFVQRNALKERRMEKESQKGGPISDAQRNPIVAIWKNLLKFFKGIAMFATRVMEGMKDMLSSVYRKTLAAILRSTVAIMTVRMIMDKFGILAVRNAWYDANQVTDHVIQGYTRPLKTKGWEMALLEYTLAMLIDSASESKPPLTKRLSEISCPVLIVTGDTDRIVPAWNATRLSSAIPGSTLEVIKNCGHLPHEEKVEEFMQVASKFLQSTFAASDEAVLEVS